MGNKRQDDDDISLDLIVLIGSYFIRAIILVVGLYLLSRILEHWR